MNVKPGQKARVAFPSTGVVGAKENTGIVVHVDRLAAPGEKCSCHVRDTSAVWHVTSLGQPFVLFQMISSGDGRYRAFKRDGTAQSVTIPDNYLIPIKDDDEDDEIVDAIVKDIPVYIGPEY